MWKEITYKQRGREKAGKKERIGRISERMLVGIVT